MKIVTLEAVTFLWLISSTRGRFIGTIGISGSEESRGSETNEITNVQNMASANDSEGTWVAREPRVSELEWSVYSVREPNGPGTFVFGYDNAIDSAGNEHYRTEERHENGTVVGEYGYTDYKINRIVHVSYTADHRGYRAKTEFSPLADSFVKNRKPGQDSL